jgi:hypothetical protein
MFPYTGKRACAACNFRLRAVSADAVSEMWFSSFSMALSSMLAGADKLGNVDKLYKCSNLLHFHHRDPKQKEFNVGEWIRNGVSLERLKAEIAKCDALCANCHARATQNERYRKKGIRF